MATNRHVHHRRDGIAVICTRRRCAPSRARELAWRAIFFVAPIAVVATGIAFGPRQLGIALALFAVGAYLVWGTHSLGVRIECANGGEAVVPPRGAATPATTPGTGSAA